ncbi:MAG TPA: DUF2339 domain-containing protein, partial [Candidatus Bathyarchaeia archaeon]|nr:DUF2339 domain-containing protein [Candidatus Bathyarchaeia archaeon]
LVCRYIEVDLFQYRLKTIWNHVVGIGLAMAFGLGYGIRRKTLVGGEPVERISSELWYCLLAGGFVLLLYCNTYAPDNWVSFLWGLAGTVLIALGILIQDARLRYGGFIAFGLVVLRIFFVDMASLGILAKTISMILVGILFLGVSFIYSRLNIGVDQGKSA